MSWSISESRVRLAPLNRFKPYSKIFTDRSKVALLLWIFYMFFLPCVCYAFVSVCLYVPHVHLLGKGWPLGSRLRCPTVSLSLSHWYPGSDVVLDCIDSWSLHPSLLYLTTRKLDVILNNVTAWVKVFRIIPKFKILRLTFHRKSASKCLILQWTITFLIQFQFIQRYLAI